MAPSKLFNAEQKAKKLASFTQGTNAGLRLRLAHLGSVWDKNKASHNNWKHSCEEVPKAISETSTEQYNSVKKPSKE